MACPGFDCVRPKQCQRASRLACVVNMYDTDHIFSTPGLYEKEHAAGFRSESQKLSSIKIHTNRRDTTPPSSANDIALPTLPPGHLYHEVQHTSFRLQRDHWRYRRRQQHTKPSCFSRHNTQFENHITRQPSNSNMAPLQPRISAAPSEDCLTERIAKAI
jgi:hypothetical protein